MAAALALAVLPTIVWAPQPGSQTLFVSCPYYEALYEGTRGPGKTNALLMDYCQHVGQGHGAAWRGVLFRQNFPDLADVVAKTKEWIPQVFPDARFNESAYVWRFSGGEELLLRYMEKPSDYWHYHGHEYPWIAWNELTNWADQKCYNLMKSCCRSSKVGVPRKYRADANPFGPGHHWVKSRFIDPAPAGTPIVDESGNTRVRIHGHYSENKILLAADPDYIARLEESTVDDPDRKNAWVGGDWNISAGSFFGGVWSRQHHELPRFEIPATWTMDRSFDWGSSKPFSVGWWAESDGSPARMVDGSTRHFARGSLFRVAEWYGCVPGKPNTGLMMEAGQIAAGIIERQQSLFPNRFIRPGPADASIFDVQDGHCIAASFKKAGVTWTVANKNPGSRKNGWELMRERLGNAKRNPMDTPGLYVFATCRDFIRTVPMLPRDEKKPDDINTAAEDHIADEARYRVLAERSTMVLSSFSI